MIHRLAVALATAALLFTTVAAQQLSTYRVETRLVVLHATVKNRSGELLTNLDRSAFTVYENGRRQPIALFRRGDVPVSLGLVIDNSGSMRSLRANVEKAALAFVRASNPLDDVFVLNFADKAHVDVPLTSDVRVLEAGIARVDSIGGTAMRDAVLLAEGYLRQHASHDRKVLLVLTDGNDNASSASIDELRKTLEQSATAVFAVGLFRDDSPSAGHGREELDHLTELTGGMAYYPPSFDQIDSVVLEIARQIRNEYTVAYAPVNQAFDGTYRAIRLEVRGPGGPSVRTRPGYWATPTPVPPSRLEVQGPKRTRQTGAERRTDLRGLAAALSTSDGARRGVTVSCEAIRQWGRTFGPEYARTLRRRMGRHLVSGRAVHDDPGTATVSVAHRKPGR